jgi:hypothetical protein
MDAKFGRGAEEPNAMNRGLDTGNFEGPGWDCITITQAGAGRHYKGKLLFYIQMPNLVNRIQFSNSSPRPVHDPEQDDNTMELPKPPLEGNLQIDDGLDHGRMQCPWIQAPEFPHRLRQ